MTRMTKEYDNTNTGLLGKNDRKTEQRHPDYKGSLTQIECPCCKAKSDFWISGWTKYNRNTGDPFVSLAIQVKDPNYKAAEKKAPGKVDDFLPAASPNKYNTLPEVSGSDDIPF